jgi:hypothetical protein
MGPPARGKGLKKGRAKRKTKDIGHFRGEIWKRKETLAKIALFKGPGLN